MLRKSCMLLSMVLAVLPCAGQADGPEIGANHVWIREAPPGVNVLAGYFTLENFSDQPLSIASVASPDFDSVMLHRSVQHDGTESMEPVKTLTIPAHKSIVFAPGGYHLMLMKPHKQLFDGDLVTLMLTFSDRSSLTIMAPVRRDQPQQ